MTIFRQSQLLRIACAVIFLFTSCSKDGDTGLVLSSAVCAFDSNGGEQTIMVGTDAGSWKAVFTDDRDGHFSLSQQEKSLTVTASANPGESTLSTTVHITAGNVSTSVRVVQSGRVATDLLKLVPDMESYAFGYEGGVLHLSVVADGEWEAASNEDWCTVVTDKTTNTFTVTSARNAEDVPLSAEVKVTSSKDGENSGITILLSQYTFAQDPYYLLTGEWELYSDEWINGYGTPMDPGVYDRFTIEPHIYDESYRIRDFFVVDSHLVVPYSKSENKITFPTGGNWDIGSNDFYIYYLMQIYVTPTTLATEKGNGGFTGMISDDRKSISIAEFGENRGFGVMGLDKLYWNLEILTNIYYPLGDGISMRKIAN